MSRCVRLDVMNASRKCRPERLVELVFGQVASQRILNTLEVILTRQLAAAGRDNAALGRQLTVKIAVIQRGQ